MITSFKYMMTFSTQTGKTILTINSPECKKRERKTKLTAFLHLFELHQKLNHGSALRYSGSELLSLYNLYVSPLLGCTHVEAPRRLQEVMFDMGFCFYSPLCFNRNTFLSSRREMMPILSLIFSALFILFGTVIIQAFR